MNFNEIAKQTSDKCGEDYNRVRLILFTFVEEIRNELARGGEVSITNFMKFGSKMTKSKHVHSVFNKRAPVVMSKPYRKVEVKISNFLKDVVRNEMTR